MQSCRAQYQQIYSFTPSPKAKGSLWKWGEKSVRASASESLLWDWISYEVRGGYIHEVLSAWPPEYDKGDLNKGNINRLTNVAKEKLMRTDPRQRTLGNLGLPRTTTTKHTSPGKSTTTVDSPVTKLSALKLQTHTSHFTEWVGCICIFYVFRMSSSPHTGNK